MKLTSSDVATIKELVKFYKKTQPVFYDGIMKACKMGAITVRHTPAVINVTDASDGSVVQGAESTLTKSKEVLISNIYGVIKYVKVSAGFTTGTIAKVGYITQILPMEIVRGVTNTFNVSLVPGIMTAEQKEAVKATIAQVIADEKAIIAAKKKAKKDAKAATAASVLLVAPVIETVAEPAAETGDTTTT